MIVRTCRIRGALICGAVVASGWLTSGCSSNDEDAATASTVCDALRSVNNEVVRVVNESVAGIAAKDPDERLPAIVRGSRGVDRVLIGWDDSIDRLELPDTEESEKLRRQLHDGLASAIDELRDQQRLFDEGEPSVADDEVQGVVGIWFNAVEKIVSSLEPEIFRFERRNFKQAFLDEPDCRNVVQPFVND